MHYLWLIPAFPLAGFLINGLLGRRLPKSIINLVAVGSVLLSFLWVVKTLQALMPLESAQSSANAPAAAEPLSSLIIITLTGGAGLIGVAISSPSRNI